MMSEESVGYVVMAAGAIHLLCRLLKSDRLNLMLATYNLPQVPLKWIPLVALGLGLLGGAGDALASGLDWKNALAKSAMGMLAGAGAIAGWEAGKLRDSGEKV